MCMCVCPCVCINDQVILCVCVCVCVCVSMCLIVSTFVFALRGRVLVCVCVCVCMCMCVCLLSRGFLSCPVRALACWLDKWFHSVQVGELLTVLLLCCSVCARDRGSCGPHTNGQLGKRLEHLALF